MFLKKTLLILTFGVLVCSSTAWTMMDSISEIEEKQIYEIKSRYSGAYLGSCESEAGTHVVSLEEDAQSEHAGYKLWHFEKIGDFYKIKSKYSGAYLSSCESEAGAHVVSLEEDAQNEHASYKLWYFEKIGDFYKIKSKYSGAYLSSCESEAGAHVVSLEEDAQNEHASYKLWYFERVGESCNTRNKYSESCLGSCQSKTNNSDPATSQGSIQNERTTKHRILYAGGCCKGACTTQQLNTYPGQGGHAEIDRYKLFSSSFSSGAVYSLLPEIFRDALESRGYYRTSSVVTTIIQGGIIVYNTSSYVPAITGIAVRYGFDQLGFSPKVSTTAGSTAAIAASFCQRLIFSHETVLDCMIDCAVGVSGSYTGSTLALKSKSWVYGLWERNNPRTA